MSYFTHACKTTLFVISPRQPTSLCNFFFLCIMLGNDHEAPPYVYSQRNVSIRLEIVNMYFVFAPMDSLSVRVSGQSRPRLFMLIKVSHWCVRGAGRLWLARSKPFILWQPRHMNGCLLTCSKTIWSCQGSGGQRRKSTVCWCFFGEATGEVLWTQHSRDLLGEGSLSHTHTLTQAHTLTTHSLRGSEGECVWRRGLVLVVFFLFFFLCVCVQRKVAEKIDR